MNLRKPQVLQQPKNATVYPSATKCATKDVAQLYHQESCKQPDEFQ